MPTHTFTVEMTCGGCSGAVERILNKLKGRKEKQIMLALIDYKGRQHRGCTA